MLRHTVCVRSLQVDEERVNKFITKRYYVHGFVDTLLNIYEICENLGESNMAILYWV